MVKSSVVAATAPSPVHRSLWSESNSDGERLQSVDAEVSSYWLHCMKTEALTDCCSWMASLDDLRDERKEMRKEETLKTLKNNVISREQKIVGQELIDAFYSNEHYRCVSVNML